MRKVLSVFLMMCGVLFAAALTTTLTFTGRDANNQHLPMDRVVIANATQGWQETIYYPDTVFTMGGTGIADNAANGDFGLKQNNPNPFIGTTYATLQTMDAGEAILEMTDVNGRIVETWCASSPVYCGDSALATLRRNGGTIGNTGKKGGGTIPQERR